MKSDLEEALVPVKWANAQIEVLQKRLLDWHHQYPYEMIVENDPDSGEFELISARQRLPLDPLISGDVGAMINSIRTGLNLTISAAVARHDVKPERAPDFPIRTFERDFLKAIDMLKNEFRLSDAEASAIKDTRAYKGANNAFFYLAALDNMRKHRQLLKVIPSVSEATLTVGGIPILRDVDDKTILYKVRRGAFRPTKGNTNVRAEVFFDEATTGVPKTEALDGIRLQIKRVSAFITSFP